MFDQHNSSSFNDRSLDMNRHTSQIFSHESHNIWHYTNANPFRNIDISDSNYSSLSHQRVMKSFVSQTKKIGIEEIIDTLGNNKWLRYALIFALTLVIISLYF